MAPSPPGAGRWWRAIARRRSPTRHALAASCARRGGAVIARARSGLPKREPNRPGASPIPNEGSFSPGYRRDLDLPQDLNATHVNSPGPFHLFMACPHILCAAGWCGNIMWLLRQVQTGQWASHLRDGCVPRASDDTVGGSNQLPSVWLRDQ